VRRITSIRVRIGTPPLSIEVVIGGEGANLMSHVRARAGEGVSAMAAAAHAAKRTRAVLPNATRDC
jgi:hypothetical protein